MQESPQGLPSEQILQHSFLAAQAHPIVSSTPLPVAAAFVAT
jgi:hypothetical protein